MYDLEMSGRRALCVSLVGAHCLLCLPGLGSASPLLLAVLVSYTDGLSGALASGVVPQFTADELSLTDSSGLLCLLYSI